MKKLTLLLTSIALISLTVGLIYSFNSKSSSELTEGVLGGITRVAIGTQTKWTTDLIPSSSFTVNLGSLTLPVNYIFGVGASLSGNLNFLGELKPDGILCSNGQILKKTAANDWDCAADASGSVSSNSLNFDEFQNPLVLDTNITTTSGSFTWNFGGTDFTGFGGVSASGDIWLSGTHHFISHGIQAIDSSGLHVHSANGTEVGFLGVANTANATWYGTHLFSGVTTDITTGTNENFTIAPNGSGITAITGNASVSVNFETVGYASATQGFFKNASISNNFEIGNASVFRLLRLHADNAINNSGIILSDDSESVGFIVHGGGFDGITTDINGNYVTASGSANINTISDGSVNIGTGMNALEGSIIKIGNAFGDVQINKSNTAGRTADTFIGGTAGSDLFILGNASVALNFETIGFASSSVFYAQDGTNSLPSYAFGNDKDTGIYRAGSNDIRLVAGTGQVSWNADSWFPADDNSKGLGYSTNRWRDLFAVRGSISAGFEIGTYASATQYFGGYASHQFRGTIEGNADDSLSIGTTAKKLHQLVSNLIKAITELIIPNAAGGPTIDKAGEIGVDTGASASGSFQFHDGVAERALKSYQSKSFTIENPAANENITLWRPGFPITIFRVDHVASDSGTSITWNIAHGADRSAAGTNLFSSGRTTNNNTNGIIETTFNDATITADEWLSFRTTASTETAGHINVTIFFRYDP